MTFWPTFNQLLATLGMPPLTRHMPYALAYGLASLAELKAKCTPGQPEPALFRLGMAVMARDFNLDISAAREYLGYRPEVTTEQGIADFSAWWQASMPALADYLPAVDAHWR